MSVSTRSDRAGHKPHFFTRHMRINGGGYTGVPLVATKVYVLRQNMDALDRENRSGL